MDALNQKNDQSDFNVRVDCVVIPHCSYCGAVAKLVDSKIIYGKSYGLIYLCDNYPICDAFVGVHKGTTKPLGTLANGELRELRKQCHSKFDPLWKEKTKFANRKDAYRWLAKVMNVKEAHIAEFNIDACRKFLALSV